MFLKPILYEVQLVNKIFQGHDNDPTRLLQEVTLLINFLKRKVFEDESIDILSNEFDDNITFSCSLGHEFETYIKQLRTSKIIKKRQEREIRSNCVQFVVGLIKQLKQRFVYSILLVFKLYVYIANFVIFYRLPDNIEILKNIDQFSVQSTLQSSKGNILPILNLFNVDDEVSSKIQDQYSKIQFIKWRNTNNTIAFWTEVFDYKDAGGNKKFKEISEFALKLLSLPWSNAEVERVFSQINLVKSNLRNRLYLTTIDSILSIR